MNRGYHSVRMNDEESSRERTTIRVSNDEDGSYLFVGFSRDVNAADSMDALVGIRDSLSSAMSTSVATFEGDTFIHYSPVSIDADLIGTFNSFTARTNTTMIKFQAFPSGKFCSETLQAVMVLLPCRGKAGVSKLLPSLAQQSAATNLRIFVTAADSNIYVNITIGALVSKGFVSDHLLSTPMETCPATTDTPFLTIKNTESTQIRAKLGSSELVEFWKDAAIEEHQVVRDIPTKFLEFTRVARDNRRDKFTVFTNVSALGANMLNSVSITICDVVPAAPHSPYAIMLDTFKYSTGLLTAPRASYIEHRPNLFTSYKRDSNAEIQEPFTHCSHVNLSQGESVLLQYDCLKVFRHRERFPHDASRGLIVQPAIVKIQDVDNFHVQTFILGSNLLITSPTPDFSMPFNVITLITTVAAFLLGAMINVLIRKTDKDTNKLK